MMEADPDFAMGQILALGLQCSGPPEEEPSPARKELKRFTSKAAEKKLTMMEQMHLEAANQLATEVRQKKQNTCYNINATLYRTQWGP